MSKLTFHLCQWSSNIESYIFAKAEDGAHRNDDAEIFVHMQQQSYLIKE